MAGSVAKLVNPRLSKTRLVLPNVGKGHFRPNAFREAIQLLGVEGRRWPHWRSPEILNLCRGRASTLIPRGCASITARNAAEGGFWCISLMRRSELTNVRAARDDHRENEQDPVSPFFSQREKEAEPVERHCVD